jgi:ribosome-associated protein
MIEIDDNIKIDEADVQFKYSRSGGPGGQNVNKVSTKVTLLYNIAESDALSAEQKDMIYQRLGTRINKEGVLRVICQKYRTQRANRDEAIRRFALLISKAVKKKRPRTRTPIPKSAVEKRLAEKKRKSRIKELRSKDIDIDN